MDNTDITDRMINVLGARPRTIMTTGSKADAIRTAEELTKEPGCRSVKLFDGVFVGAPRLYAWRAEREFTETPKNDRHWRTCVILTHGWSSREAGVLGTADEAIAFAHQLATDEHVTRVRLFDGLPFIAPLILDINPKAK